MKMVSRVGLISTWSILALLLMSYTQGQSTNAVPTTNVVNEATSTPAALAISSTGKSETSITTNDSIQSTGEYEPSIPAAYMLTDATGQPCLLATFNITVKVSYYIKTGKLNNRYIAFQKLRVPTAEQSPSSSCGENSSSLILEWANSTFNLNLTFITHGRTDDGIQTNWTLDSIAFTYNLSNQLIFPGAVDGDEITQEENDLMLFNTKIGRTKECDKLVKVTIGEEELGSVFTFEYVKLAPFNVTSKNFPEEVEQCTEKIYSLRDEDIMVPLIIACSLTFVIIVVVVAYAISRKFEQTRDQTQYKPMP